MFSFNLIADNPGTSSHIVCPNSFANLYPSPVEPVVGYDNPPVAITKLSTKYLFSLAITSNNPFTSVILFAFSR